MRRTQQPSENELLWLMPAGGVWWVWLTLVVLCEGVWPCDLDGPGCSTVRG